MEQLKTLNKVTVSVAKNPEAEVTSWNFSGKAAANKWN